MSASKTPASSSKAAATARVLADRAEVERLRASLASERTLVEPRGESGEVEWREASADEPFCWDLSLPLASAKHFFFAEREPLLRWTADQVVETLPAPRPFALFGLRACDLTAIAYQDGFFAGDPWYRRRREAALLVGVNCLTACPGGFCREVDAGPFARSAFDLNLTPLADGRVVVETGSAAGEAALAAAQITPARLDAGAADAFQSAEWSAVESFPERPFIRHAIERMNEQSAARSIPDAEWAKLGPACFACTGCTSLCPTCSCFTTFDDVQSRACGERVRLWDSCLLEGFQREASGHSPSPTPGDRVRRFWYHKLSTDFAGDDLRLGCVGCGRCDVTCPGSIGALRVLGGIGAR